MTAAAFGQAANPAIPPEATQPLIPDPDAGAASSPAATAQTPAPTPAPTGQVPQATAPGTISTTAKPAAAPNASNTPAANNPAPELQQQKGNSNVFVMRKDVEEVILHATVVDDHQRLVTSLDRNSFTVFEDGRQAPITSFRHEDIPVAVGILVDNSGSMRDKRAAVSQAALNFVRSSNVDDRVFIVNFADEPFLDQPYTSDVAKLKEALDRLDSRGGTALYDAVLASADEFTKEPPKGRGGRPLDKRVLLVITDGVDDASAQSLEDVVQKLQAENAPTVYTIGILDEDDRRKGKRALKELAEQTGGVAFFPRDLTEVDAITRQVAHDIRNQYTIGFKKNPQGGTGYRTVRVEARANGYKGLQVRTRTGYFPGEETAAK